MRNFTANLACSRRSDSKAREKNIPHATLHFICVWPGTFWTISSWLEQIRNSLICWKMQQKIHETHKIWHRSEQKITSLFTSIRDSNISRVCVKILEIPEQRQVNFGGCFWKIWRGGGRVIRQILLWGWYGYFLEPHNVHQKRYYGFVQRQWCASLF